MQLMIEEIDTIEVERNRIPTIQMTERYSVTRILSLSSLAIRKKSKISEDLCRLLFKDLTITNYNQRTHVYTDGSRLLTILEVQSGVNHLVCYVNCRSTHLYLLPSSIQFMTQYRS